MERQPTFSWNLAQTVAIWLVSALLAWGVVQTRLAVLEDRQERLVEDVREIKGDLKALLRQQGLR